MSARSSKPRILVYGIEKLGLQYPAPSVSLSLCELDFEPMDTSKNFQDFDGVILFQSTFETIQRVTPYMDSPYWDITYNRSELLRRRNQLRQLLEGIGFVCFLLYRDFIDRSKYADYRHTDLAKIYIPADMSKESFGADVSITALYRGEFEPFIKDYGSARTKFSYYSRLDSYIRKICDSGNRNLSGFIAFDNRYFVPCRLPFENEVKDFFTKIATALVATAKKLKQEIPQWVEEYKFPPEDELLSTEALLNQQLEDIQTKKDIWKGYKRCLCYDGELLVESVSEVLKELGLKLSGRADENIEDKVILDDNGEDIALVEIKGINDNVKSMHVYQADSHRGRREKPEDFPAILIINTFIKSSNSLKEKLRDIEPEQVSLAYRKKVLVMRTIDLLNLLHLKGRRQIDKDKITEIFTGKAGWLKVTQESYQSIEA